MHSNSSSGSRPSLNSLSSKRPFQALALGVAILPFNSLNAEKSHQYNTVVNTNVLTVVAVENPTTVFKEGQFLHGFGYDLARNYAQSLNVKLDFKTILQKSIVKIIRNMLLRGSPYEPKFKKLLRMATKNHSL